METNYKEKAKKARLKVLEMIYRGQTSHIASNFSIIDVATVLYSNLKEKDEVVWSKGWAAATIYYFLAEQGKIPKEDLDKFLNEPYLGLAETKVPGVLCNGGSVGHGLPIACGIALAKKLKGEEGNVYCIMSDGEMNEGTTWESAMFAAHHKLNNLVVIIDKNDFQAMGRTREVLDISLVDIFSGFKFEIEHIYGHDHEELNNTLWDNIWFKNSPKVIICETIKGKGVSFMEDKLLYHYKNLSEEEYLKAKEEIENA